jgi:hypothetical protein
MPQRAGLPIYPLGPRPSQVSKGEPVPTELDAARRPSNVSSDSPLPEARAYSPADMLLTGALYSCTEAR